MQIPQNHFQNNNNQQKNSIVNIHYGDFLNIAQFLSIEDVFLTLPQVSKSLYNKVNSLQELISKDKIEQILKMSIGNNINEYQKIEQRVGYKTFLCYLLSNQQPNLASQELYYLQIQQLSEKNVPLPELQSQKLFCTKSVQKILQQQLTERNIENTKYEEIQKQQKVLEFGINDINAFGIGENIEIGLQNPFLLYNTITICRAGKYCFPAKTCAIFYSNQTKQQLQTYDLRQKQLEFEYNQIKNVDSLNQFLLNFPQISIFKSNIQYFKEKASYFDPSIEESEIEYVVFQKNNNNNVKQNQNQNYSQSLTEVEKSHSAPVSIVKQKSLKDIDDVVLNEYLDMDLNEGFSPLIWVNYKKKSYKTQQIQLNGMRTGREFRIQMIDFDLKKKLENYEDFSHNNLNQLLFKGQLIQ